MSTYVWQFFEKIDLSTSNKNKTYDVSHFRILKDISLKDIKLPCSIG